MVSRRSGRRREAGREREGRGDGLGRSGPPVWYCVRSVLVSWSGLIVGGLGAVSVRSGRTV